MECVNLGIHSTPPITCAPKADIVKASSKLIEVLNKYQDETKGYYPFATEGTTVVLSLSNLSKALECPWFIQKDGRWMRTKINIAYAYSKVDIEVSKEMFIKLRDELFNAHPSFKNVERLQQLVNLQAKVDPEEAKKTLQEMVTRVVGLHEKGEFMWEVVINERDLLLIKIIKTGVELSPEDVKCLLDVFNKKIYQTRGYTAYACGLIHHDYPNKEIETYFRKAEECALKAYKPLESLIKVAAAEMRFDPEFSQTILSDINDQILYLEKTKKFLAQDLSRCKSTIKHLEMLKAKEGTKWHQQIEAVSKAYKDLSHTLYKSLESDPTNPDSTRVEKLKIIATQNLEAAEKLISDIEHPNYVASAYSVLAQAWAKKDIKKAWEMVDKIPAEGEGVFSDPDLGEAIKSIAVEKMKDGWKNAFKIADQIEWQSARDSAKVSIIKKFAAENLSQMKIIAESMEDKFYRTKAFSIIAYHELMSDDPTLNEDAYQRIREDQAAINLVFEEFARNYDLGGVVYSFV